MGAQTEKLEGEKPTNVEISDTIGQGFNGLTDISMEEMFGPTQKRRENAPNFVSNMGAGIESAISQVKDVPLGAFQVGMKMLDMVSSLFRNLGK